MVRSKQCGVADTSPHMLEGIAFHSGPSVKEVMAQAHTHVRTHGVLWTSHRHTHRQCTTYTVYIVQSRARSLTRVTDDYLVPTP